MDNYISKPLFSYLINTTEKSLADYKKVYKIGSLFFHCDELTTVDYSIEGDSTILLFGDIVDTRNGESSQLAQELLRNADSLNDLICCENEYGGKYIILYSKGSHVFLIPDATCSIPVFYNIHEGESICSDRCMYLALAEKMKEDDKLKKIREHSDIYQAMPSDITTYKYIKALLPNHYLCIDKRKSTRIINQKDSLKPLPVQDATNSIIPRIENMASYYSHKYELRCPLTGGKDSRVVFAFLKQQNRKIRNYTIIHNTEKPDNSDYEVPRIISNKCNMIHDEIYDKEPHESLKQYVDNYLGEGTYSYKTLMIASTIKDYCLGCGIVNGDIIGQVGKCSLHRNIPDFLATKRYFRRKMHNFSYESLKYIQDWINDIQTSEEKTNLYDLFSIENRMGRWAGQENSIYNAIGQHYMNIFNSRSIIYSCTRVDRRERAHGKLHIELLRQTNKQLLTIPFGMDESCAEKVARSSWPIYYISSILKYCLERIHFVTRRNMK